MNPSEQPKLWKEAKELEEDILQNQAKLDEIRKSLDEIWGRTFHTNPDVTPGVLKGMKLRRLLPKAINLHDLVKAHKSADIKALLSLVETIPDYETKTTKNDAVDFLELLELSKKTDLESAQSWANAVRSTNASEADELVQIWNDMKKNANPTVVGSAVFLRRLKNADKDTEDKRLLDLLKALAK